MPKGEKNISQDPIGDADKSLGILNNVIESVNQRRLDIKNSVIPKKKNTIQNTEQEEGEEEKEEYTNNEQE